MYIISAQQAHDLSISSTHMLEEAFMKIRDAALNNKNYVVINVEGCLEEVVNNIKEKLIDLGYTADVFDDLLEIRW